MADEDSLVSRMIFLTDGVTAIAMTLLVLDIRLPEAIKESGPGWADLSAIREQLFGFALSFVVVALLWRAHAQKFRRLRRATGALFWLNTLFLLAVALVPFTTSLLAASGNGTATAVYAVTIGFAAVMLGLMSVHVRLAGLSDEAPAGAGSSAGLLVNFAPAAVFFASAILSLWSPTLAQYSWFLLIPLASISDRIRPAG